MRMMNEKHFQVGARGFLGITRDWGCTAQQKADLLDLPMPMPESPNELAAFIDEARLYRVSRILGIYADLRRLHYPERESADQKIHDPIDEAPFSGRNLLTFILADPEVNLASARDWLSKKVRAKSLELAKLRKYDPFYSPW